MTYTEIQRALRKMPNDEAAKLIASVVRDMKLGERAELAFTIVDDLPMQAYFADRDNGRDDDGVYELGDEDAYNALDKLRVHLRDADYDEDLDELRAESVSFAQLHGTDMSGWR